jgi:transposase-like protein
MQNAELARLRREVTALQEENGFLKEAAAYLAKVSK